MDTPLPDLDHTARLGRDIAGTLLTLPPLPLLLIGSLGAGKTTLIRHIVENLPGGEQAEVSSPSFNLVNVYPTRPRVVHMDVYRLGSSGFDESLAEYLDSGPDALLVEWADFLPEQELPPEYIHIELSLNDSGRHGVLTAIGPKAEAWLQHLEHIHQRQQ